MTTKPQLLLTDDDVKLAHELASKELGYSCKLDVRMKWAICDVLCCDPWTLQSWINSKSSEEISDLLF